MLIDITTEFSGWSNVPDLDALINTAALAAVYEQGEEFKTHAELSILLTSDAAIHKLNAQYRGRDKPTNVISFSGENIARAKNQSFLLGDVVLSYQTISAEAQAQSKRLNDHICHLIVHGILHLLGHDHENEEMAHEMEQKEIKILKGMGIENPYATAQ